MGASTNTAMSQVLSQIRPPVYRCPSSPFPEVVATQNQMWSSYVTVAGSDLHPTTDHFAGVMTGSGSAYASAGGAFPGNKSVQFRDFTDGLSNTILIGEQSNWLGTNRENRTATPSDSGPWMGGKNLRLPSGDNTFSASVDGRCFNLTTIRQAPNPQVLADYQKQQSCNTPLASAHVGGVHLLLGDGAVRFISDNINQNTLKYLADKDDGQVVGEF
jgi:hypothetical protein